MIVEVTAAIIIQDDTVFIAKKGPHGRFAHKWEFPGGKMEAGESPESCVAREIMEEFGIEIEVVGFFAQSIHTFPEGRIKVLSYFCRWTSGEITPTEHEDYRWAPIKELGKYEFAPADIPLAEKLRAEYTR